MRRLLSVLTAVIMFVTAWADYSFAISEEDALENLVADGIIIGMTDGELHPEYIVSRAEMAMIICRELLGPGAAARLKVSSTDFTDVSYDNWAAAAIIYCKNLGIVQGYGDGRFGPADIQQTYQCIKMLLKAYNKLSPEDEATLPEEVVGDEAVQSVLDFYESHGRASGLLEGLEHKSMTDFMTRGDAAVMCYNAYKNFKLSAESDPEENAGNSGGSTGKENGNNTNSGKDTNEAKDKGDSSGATEVENNPLADFMGTAYCVIVGKGKAVNSKGDPADSAEVRIGTNTYTLVDKNADASDGLRNVKTGDLLVKLTIRSGEVYKAEKVVKGMNSYGSTQTLITAFENFIPFKVLRIKKDYLEFLAYDGGGTDDVVDTLNISDPCVVYRLGPDRSNPEYTISSVADIEKDDYVVAAYTIDKESSGAADIIIYVDEKDAHELGV